MKITDTTLNAKPVWLSMAQLTDGEVYRVCDGSAAGAIVMRYSYYSEKTKERGLDVVCLRTGKSFTEPDRWGYLPVGAELIISMAKENK